MKGLGNMKKLRYLEVNFAAFDYWKIDADDMELDEATQFFTNSLKYLRCTFYPFLYLPKTFQAKNLVGLDMKWSKMVQLWEDVEKKVLRKLNFLNYLHISHSKLRTFNLGLTPNLETLSLLDCADFVELQVSVPCPNLRFLELYKTRLRSLDLELIPNLEILDLQYSRESEPKENCSSATLDLDDLKKFSDIICSLQCLQKLTLKGDIPEFPDLGQLECLEVLSLHSEKIKHLPYSICMLKRLKSLKVDNEHLLEKLTEDLGQLDSLEKLKVRSKKIEYLPNSICMLKRLKSLEVRTGDLLEKLPEDLGNLECLENLYVRGEKIEYLPDSICMLKRLKSLVVNNCDLLQKLPDDLG
nr:disease resistance protein (TIR-NBS-LRR class) family [Tanacetum cinerariifolium]